MPWGATRNHSQRSNEQIMTNLVSARRGTSGRLPVKAVFAVLATVGVLVGAGCGRRGGEPVADTTKKVLPVKVLPVTLGSIAERYQTSGTVAAGTEADVAPQVEGQLVSLPHREGDRVAAGAVLVKLDSTEPARQVAQAETEVAVARASLRDLLAGSRPEEIAQAEAALRQTQAAEKRARQALEHTRELYRPDGGLPAQTMDAARGKVDVAQAQLTAAKAAEENARLTLKNAQDEFNLNAEQRLRIEESEGRLAAAEAQVRAAETTVADAKLDYDRTRQMTEVVGFSQERLDKSKARLDTVQAQLEATRAARVASSKALQRAREIESLKVGMQQKVDDARTKLTAFQAQVKAAEEVLRAAQRDFGHVQTLQQGPVPQKEIDDAENRLAESRAAVQQTEQRLRLLKSGPTVTQIQVARERVAQAESKVALSRTKLEYCTLRAPAAGMITKRWQDVGDLARPGSPILTLATAGHLVVKAAVPDRYAARVQIGTPVDVTLDARPEPLSLTVTRLYRAADVQSRLMSFEAALPSEVKAPIGSLARVAVVLERREGVPVVSADALLPRAAGQRVAFVVQQGKAVQRPVEVGLESEGNAEIVSGLLAGDQVVIAGQEMLKDGMEVKLATGKGKGKGGKGPAGAGKAPGTGGAQ